MVKMWVAKINVGVGENIYKKALCINVLAIYLLFMHGMSFLPVNQTQSHFFQALSSAKQLRGII